MALSNETKLRRALARVIDDIDDYFAQFTADGDEAPFRDEARALGRSVAKAMDVLRATRPPEKTPHQQRDGT